MSDLTTYLAAVEGTWPPAERQEIGPWIIRRGLGGGKRVSAASAIAPVTEGEITLAESAMAALDQEPLFQLTPEQADLDALLEARGYEVVDATNLYAAPVDALADLATNGDLSALSGWEPLAIQLECWANGGIGPERVAVMDRVAGPKTSFILRLENAPGGTAFAAIHDGIAMMHALEVEPVGRRQGMGRYATISVARWARAQGATELAILCTQANTAANGLYSSLGLRIVGGYHYRQKPKTGDA